MSTNHESNKLQAACLQPSTIDIIASTDDIDSAIASVRSCRIKTSYDDWCDARRKQIVKILENARLKQQQQIDSSMQHKKEFASMMNVVSEFIYEVHTCRLFQKEQNRLIQTLSNTIQRVRELSKLPSNEKLASLLEQADNAWIDQEKEKEDEILYEHELYTKINSIPIKCILHAILGHYAIVTSVTPTVALYPVSDEEKEEYVEMVWVMQGKVVTTILRPKETHVFVVNSNKNMFEMSVNKVFETDVTNIGKIANFIAPLVKI